MGSDGTPEEKAVLRKKESTSFTPMLKAIAFVAMIGSSVLIMYTLKLGHEGRLRVLGGKGIPGDGGKTYGTKLEFTVRYWLLPLIWFKLNIYLVILKRVPSRAVNPLDGHEHIVEGVKNILTNTLEQMVASLVMQSILISFLTPDEVVNFIPLINLLFFLGRITFWLGYPLLRTFGFMTTSLPTSVGLGVCVYRCLTRHFGFVL